MKIRVRLILVIIPVLLILHISTTLISGYFSTKILEKQARENAQLLSHSFSSQLNSSINHYLNVSQDLGSTMITAIHIETTLKIARKRYPQFTNIFYAPAGDDVLEMAPYRPELLGFELDTFKAYNLAIATQKPTMSEAGYFFGEKSVIFFAPAILSFVQDRPPLVQGIVALVLPLKDLFIEVKLLAENSSGSLYVIDNKGVFLHHESTDVVLTGNTKVITTHPIIDEIFTSMIDQKAGFATYTSQEIKNYIAFSPIAAAHWSLGIYGSYDQIVSEIDRIAFINVMVTIIVLFIGAILLYFVVRSVVQPIEELTDIAKKIADGDKDIISSIQTSSEVGTLSSTINSMVEELRNHQSKLEQTVKTRTIALKTSNNELHETIKELDLTNTALQETRQNLEILVDERTEQLQKALNYIDNIIDSMPSILIGIDPKGVITHWNAEAERFTATAPKEATGKKLTDIVPHFAEIMDDVFTAIETRQKINKPKQIRQDGNDTIYESITIYPLVSNGIDGAVIRVDDISDRVVIEKSLHQSQKLDAIGLLAGGIAHDFNNMLSGILGAAQLLKLPSHNLDQKGLNYIELIIKSVSRASDLTGKLLAFSRKSERKFTPINIHKVIDDAGDIFIRTFDKRIKIVVEKNAEYSTVIGDSSALQSAIMNIGINASHAMPEGGEIKLSTQNITLNASFCDASPFDIKPGSFFDLAISDTGLGIPKNDIEKIFEPFFTTKESDKGTGLGLSAVYGTVQDHNGAINVYSEKGRGTIFHIYIPCSERVDATFRKNQEVIRGSGTILLVDDEELIRLTGESLLNEMGYTVLVAENGLKGLEVFSRNSRKIDLVVLDMIMPEMNGHEAFFKMKEIDPAVKIIIASGFTKDESLFELQEAGLSGFIRKPFRDFELSRLIADILSKKS